MENLQKDLAIFKAMYGFANELFFDACNASPKLREEIGKCGNAVSVEQLTKSGSDLNIAFNDTIVTIAGDVCHIEIDGFECQFQINQVFDLLKYWKSLAKVKGEIMFAYEEQVDMTLVTTIGFAFDNATLAKKLAKCTSKEEFRPALNCVLAEVNLDTELVSFVASDGHIISVITTDVIGVHRNNPYDHVLRALFTAKDWERICDYAKKNGNSVEFEFYCRKEMQVHDTAIACCGDMKIKSVLQSFEDSGSGYPNWHRVIPFEYDYQHLRLTKEAQKEFVNYFKAAKSQAYHVILSAYEGCKYLYLDETDVDFGKNIEAKFELVEPATRDVCFGAAKHQMLKFQTEGMWIGNSNQGILLDSKEFDITLVMPCIDSEGQGYSIDEETADERRGFSLNQEPEVVEEEACVAA